MTKPSPTLYVSDLDATLLNERGELSDYSRSVLRQLIADGLPMTIASARSVYSMRAIMAGVPFSLPVIEFNGAFVSDWHTGHHMYCETLATDAVREFYRQGEIRDMPPFVTTVNQRDEDKLYVPTPRNLGMAWLLEDRWGMKDPRLENVADLHHDFLGEEAVCMTFVGKQDQIENLRQWVSGSAADACVWHTYENNYHKGWYWLSVHPPKASKGRALRWLADHLDMDTRHICVFGDHDNDASMFAEAGHAVAVSNAIPSLRDMAHEVIGTNLDDSVVKYLEKMHPTNSATYPSAQ